MFIQDEVHKDCRIIEGHFESPFCKHLPGIMPPETEIARQVDDCTFLLCIYLEINGDVMEPAKIRILRMWISCAKSVGCGCGFVARTKLVPAITVTEI